MKKRIAICLLAALMVCMAGCSADQDADPSTPSTSLQSTESIENSSTAASTEPNMTEAPTAPPATEPEPTVTEPPATEAPTEPPATEPEPTATEPPATEAPTEPPATDPEPTEPPATEHMHDYSAKVRKPTCTKKGYTKYTCECGDSYKDNYVDKLEHNYSSKIVAPTCEKKGYTKYTCECGGSYKDDYVDKVDHNYVDYVCTECGERASGPINGMDIVKEALPHIGLEYVHGGNSLTKGTDCSGFTSLIYKEFGVSLPRTAADQSTVGKEVSFADAKPGDLYAEKYEDHPTYTGHAGIYMGNGWLLSAWPGQGVRVTQVSESTTFRRVFDNSYEGTYEDILNDIHLRCFELGMYGYYLRTSYDPSTGEVEMEGISPIEGDYYIGADLNVNLSHIPEGYEEMAEDWKKQYEQGDRSFSIDAFGESWGYYEGTWYTNDEIYQIKIDKGLDISMYHSATEFYGAIWDPDSVITTDLGEVVDMSTFPSEAPTSTIPEE